VARACRRSAPGGHTGSGRAWPCRSRWARERQQTRESRRKRERRRGLLCRTGRRHRARPGLAPLLGMSRIRSPSGAARFLRDYMTRLLRGWKPSVLLPLRKRPFPGQLRPPPACQGTRPSPGQGQIAGQGRSRSRSRRPASRASQPGQASEPGRTSQPGRTSRRSFGRDATGGRRNGRHRTARSSLSGSSAGCGPRRSSRTPATSSPRSPSRSSSTTGQDRRC
jgi:hypothetical protein